LKTMLNCSVVSKESLCFWCDIINADLEIFIQGSNFLRACCKYEF
jgi:hypothetical protein